jgi:branched-chain amino acid transport system substrate-binding protein
MRKRLSHRRGATGLVAVALLVASCSSSPSSSSTSTKKPLLIGISLSLTGDFADPGKAAQSGYELWRDAVNAKGGILGRQVQLKIVDDASSPDQVVTNYTNLIDKDKVDLVFGPFSSLLTVPASQVAKRFSYSFIEPAGGGPKVFDQKLDNLFFVQPAPVVAGGEVFAKWVLSLPADQRPKTAAYPSLDDPFASPIADRIRELLEAGGIKTVYNETYSAETTDLSPVVTKVAAASPDLVVAGTQSDDAYAQVKAMVEQKFSPKMLFMSNGANSPVEFPDKVGAGNVNGIFSTSAWLFGSDQPGNKDFVAAYIKKFGGKGSDIDETSAQAYACGQLLEAVAAKTGKVDNATIIASLHQGSWPTLMGQLSWDAIGQPQGATDLVQWIDGSLQVVYPADQAKHDATVTKPAWGG